MKETVQQLVQLVFQKDSIEDCSLNEVQAVSRQYPYFAPLQLLVAEKLRAQHPAVYQKQLQKTALYFHDPLWFDYLLNREEYNQKELITIEARPRHEEIPLDFEGEPEEEWVQPVKESLPEPTVSDEVPATEFPAQDEQIPEETNQVHEETVIAPEQPAIPENSEPDAEIVLAQENLQQINTEHTIDRENGNYDEEEHDLDENEIREMQNQPELNIPALKQEPISSAETVLTFEPYHTVDYFASQGIKLTLQEKGDDQFGRQLKSFTEWLKSMKRLPESEVVKNIDPGTEKKVQSLAEHSIEDREIVTEAMGEVWEKQGNHEKAIEIYNKLSLLDPSKSAYFAGKIEQLKKEN